MPQTMGLSNIELMRTLDNAWNAQDWETFEKRHTADTVVFWLDSPNLRAGEPITRQSPSNSLSRFLTTIS